MSQDMSGGYVDPNAIREQRLKASAASTIPIRVTPTESSEVVYEYAELPDPRRLEMPGAPPTEARAASPTAEPVYAYVDSLSHC